MRPRTTIVTTLAAVGALALAGTAAAHYGPHWTPQQAAKRLIKNDIEWQSGEVDIVTNASCVGRGHSFIAANGHRVFGQFLCWVKTEREAPYYVRMTSQPGNNYRLKFLYYA